MLQKEREITVEMKTRRHRSSHRRRTRTLKRGGATLSPLQVQFPSGVKSPQQPIATWKAVPSKLYTLLCIDPDAPGANAPWLHWLIINCKGGSPSSGKIITPWTPPTPPPGTGVHRYQFKVFEQPAPFEYKPPASRAAFPFDAFIREKGMSLLAEKEVQVKALPL